MKKFLSFFTHDGWLKLLALALAILVYCTVREKSADTPSFLRRDVGADAFAPVLPAPPPAPVITPNVPAPESPLNVK